MALRAFVVLSLRPSNKFGGSTPKRQRPRFAEAFIAVFAGRELGKIGEGYMICRVIVDRMTVRVEFRIEKRYRRPGPGISRRMRDIG